MMVNHKCAHCKRVFVRPAERERHMRTHTGEQPYSCKECGKRFARRFSLTRHEETHLRNRTAAEAVTTRRTAATAATTLRLSFAGTAAEVAEAAAAEASKAAAAAAQAAAWATAAAEDAKKAAEEAKAAAEEAKAAAASATTPTVARTLKTYSKTSRSLLSVIKAKPAAASATTPTVARMLKTYSSVQRGKKKMKMTETERSPQEHAADFPPEVHVVDEATTEEVDSETDSEEEDVNCSTAETKTKPEDKKSRFLNDVLMQTPYRHAKAKNMKIYTPKEVDSVTGMEKKRRQFWNEKADQLAKNKETRDQSKTALCGIIDVSWTLRKTAMLEAEAKKLMEDEKVLFRKEDATSRKLGKQKKDTILKNVDRMSAAHQAVEEHDQKVTGVQKLFKEATTLPDRKKFTKKYEREKLLMDGAYTELKRAQDALSKSIKVKRTEIENRLKVGTEGEDSEDVAPSTSGEI